MNSALEDSENTEQSVPRSIARRTVIVNAAMGAVGILLAKKTHALARQAPTNLYYSRDHHWIRVVGQTAILGVTGHVRDSGRKIVHLQLPDIGKTFKANERFGSIWRKRTKGSARPEGTIQDLTIPVSGTLTQINKEVQSNLTWIDDEPYTLGWIMELRLTNKRELLKLMNAAEYEKFIKVRPHVQTHEWPYVVTEPCVNCKYTDCAAVCPVGAFHQLPDRLYINHRTCISCDLCVPECPVEAIFDSESRKLPGQYQEWIFLNIAAQNYPVIKQKLAALGSKCKDK